MPFFLANDLAGGALFCAYTKYQGLVVGQPGAIIGANFTNASADSTGHLMKRRTTQHEVGAGDTDLRAILHQANVSRAGMAWSSRLPEAL
jgi:hypothetical protein